MTYRTHGSQRSTQPGPDRPLDALDTCPACGEHAALITLGERIDHPYRWRPWASVSTELYLCNHCDALVEVQARQGQRVQTIRPKPPARAA